MSVAMLALPDPAVIARLANEFFAALPGNATPENVGASAPGRATTSAVPVMPARFCRTAPEVGLGPPFGAELGRTLETPAEGLLAKLPGPFGMPKAAGS